MSKPSGKLEFITSHKPALPDGDYTLTVQQSVEADGAHTFPETRAYFSVAGPRFSLNPQMIRAVFPPDKSLGEYYKVLPHIVFNRTTLLWERTLDGTQNQPWLALLLFDQSELTAHKIETKTITVETLLQKPEAGAGVFSSKIKKETGQHYKDRVQVIDVPKSLLWTIMPTRAELALLAHIRQGKTKRDKPVGDEHPILVGNRLPKPGSESVVHLVSLEKRNDLLNELASATKPGDEKVRLVTLKSWRFASVTNKHTFKQLFTDADRTPSVLRQPDVQHARADGFLRQGYVPTPHLTRQGNHVVSWYRGPLIPGNAPADPNVPLPARASDQLVRYHHDIGMFDTSYAAAWEIGRLMTLQSRAVSVALFNWKRTHAQRLKQDAAQVAHLPFAPTPALPDLPRSVADWFDDLALLKHIPFPYLVPCETMLPRESIRFFKVNPVWVECLLDGAFSIGRVLATDHQADGKHRAAVVPKPPVISGFLLRSQVVTGWPHMQIEGHKDRVPSAQKEAFVPQTDTLKMVREDRLAPDVLLCLFEGDVKTVDFHEKPEMIHCGVDFDPGRTPKYYKELRNVQTGVPSGDKKDLKWKHDKPDSRAVNIADLAGQIRDTRKGALNSAEFGLEMIEGVEKVRFIVDDSG